MVFISEDLHLSVFLLSHASVMFSSPDFRMQFFSPKPPSPPSDLGGTARAVGNSTLGFSIWTPCIAWVTLLSSAECIATVGAGTGGYVEGPLKALTHLSSMMNPPKSWFSLKGGSTSNVWNSTWLSSHPLTSQTGFLTWHAPVLERYQSLNAKKHNVGKIIPWEC